MAYDTRLRSRARPTAVREAVSLLSLVTETQPLRVQARLKGKFDAEFSEMGLNLLKSSW